MTDLLRKPDGTRGQTHAITPETAGWGYVGFDLWRLSPGDLAKAQTGGREAILVLVEGHARLAAGGEDFGLMGDRMTVFDRKPPHCLYVPPGRDWRAVAETDCTLAVCTAPARAAVRRSGWAPRGSSLRNAAPAPTRATSTTSRWKPATWPTACW